MPCRVVNLIGNHELYNFDRSQLADSGLDVAPTPDRRSFYTFSPAPGWRVVALDSYQESLIGWPEDDPRRRRAAATLAANNPNLDPNDLAKNGNWLEGIRGLQRRFVPYNGALGEEQIEWLTGELRKASAARERVIILSHAILSPRACDGTTMVWDYEKALQVIRQSGVVAMVVCGHDHNGGYHRDRTGIHHLTLCSPLNAGTGGHAYGLLEVYDDRIELVGPRLAELLPLKKKHDLASTLVVRNAGSSESEALRFDFGASPAPPRPLPRRVSQS